MARRSETGDGAAGPVRIPPQSPSTRKGAHTLFGGPFWCRHEWSERIRTFEWDRGDSAGRCRERDRGRRGRTRSNPARKEPMDPSGVPFPNPALSGNIHSILSVGQKAQPRRSARPEAMATVSCRNSLETRHLPDDDKWFESHPESTNLIPSETQVIPASFHTMDTSEGP